MEEYLGDGLYFKDDGWMITLYTTREFGQVHEVCLEPSVMENFFSMLEKSRNLKMEIKKIDQELGE